MKGKEGKGMWEEGRRQGRGEKKEEGKGRKVGGDKPLQNLASDRQTIQQSSSARK